MICCYYPTTIAAIDDDINFLTVLTQSLELSDWLTYTSPHQAIKSLQPQNSFERIRSEIVKATNARDEITPEDHVFLVNLKNLHKEIYNINRFQDISVIIVDYYMDEMTGLEVCERLKNHPAKKILLTGGIDKEKVAIDAFNKGIIHRFINKNDANFPYKLKIAISTLKDSYFNGLTSKLLSHTDILQKNFWQHPIYVSFTRSIQDQFDIVEHYLLDVNGSRLMLNAKGESVWFVVKHISDMDNDKALAIDQEASDHLIQGLTNKTLIPFFFSENDYQQPAIDWESFFHPCQTFPGIDDFYYAIYQGNQSQHIDTNKLISYEAYRLSKV